MTELLKVTYDNDTPTVSARDLHEFLEVRTAYKDWFPRMCEYGFTEGIDFCSILSESTGGRPAQDASLTVEMAKELCMLQRNERGKLARQYFIQLERDWNSPEKVMARALKIANAKINRLQDKVEHDAPKVLLADAVAASHAPMLIGELAKILKQNGINTGEKRLFKWLRNNGYLIKRRGIDHNMPTQRAMELGLFEVKQTAVTHSDGLVTTSRATRVTGRGQQYFINRFLNQPK